MTPAPAPQRPFRAPAPIYGDVPLRCPSCGTTVLRFYCHVCGLDVLIGDRIGVTLQ